MLKFGFFGLFRRTQIFGLLKPQADIFTLIQPKYFGKILAYISQNIHYLRISAMNSLQKNSMPFFSIGHLLASKISSTALYRLFGNLLASKTAPRLFLHFLSSISVSNQKGREKLAEAFFDSKRSPGKKGRNFKKPYEETKLV